MYRYNVSKDSGVGEEVGRGKGRKEEEENKEDEDEDEDEEANVYRYTSIKQTLPYRSWRG